MGCKHDGKFGLLYGSYGGEERSAGRAVSDAGNQQARYWFSLSINALPQSRRNTSSRLQGDSARLVFNNVHREDEVLKLHPKHVKYARIILVDECEETNRLSNNTNDFKTKDLAVKLTTSRTIQSG